MKYLQLKCLSIFLFYFFIKNTAISQNLLADTPSSPAVKNALAFYNTTFKEQLNLYNGKEYKDYLHPFQLGHPYFLTKDWGKGTVDYDGNTYDNVSILYDLIADEVIILSYNKISKINLFKDKLSAFSVSGHSFINIQKSSLPASDLKPGFYDVLVKGKVSLLSRRTKNIQMSLTQTVELRVLEKDHFYLKKGNEYFSVDNKKSLLKQLADKRKELHQFARRNKLKFGKAPENSMIKIVERYNQLTKK